MAININHSKNTIKTEDKLTIEAENNVSVTNNRITDLQDPIDDQDAVTKSFLAAYTDGGTFTYSNTTPMPEEVGGYEVGDTFTNATLQQLFTNLLYPYQYPTVTSFSISGQATTLEVGDSVAGGSRTFAWNISNNTNITVNSVTVEDVTNGTVYGSTYASDGSESIDIGDAIIKTSAQSNTWKLSAQNTKGQTISKNYSVNWRWRTYYGTSDQESLSEAQVKALVSSSLDSNFTGNKPVAGNNYKYFVYPTAFGLKNNFQDVISGFAIAMNPATTITITNSFGISTEYYVHRTTNPIVGALTVSVS